MNLGEARGYKTDGEKSNPVSEPRAVATGSGSDVSGLFVRELELKIENCKMKIANCGVRRRSSSPQRTQRRTINHRETNQPQRNQSTTFRSRTCPASWLPAQVRPL